MCGRYTLTPEQKVIQKRFNVKPGPYVHGPRYNIAPSQLAPVVINERENVLKMMKWGLVPYWAKDINIGFKLINARAETITEKPSFKTAFKKNRCLVLADGFYEWDKKQGRQMKIPHRFVLKSGKPFAFAGLWDVWMPPQGEPLHSFTIITTGPNELMEPIHNRMPVILGEENEELWLDLGVRDENTLLSLLKPYEPGLMEEYEVSAIVNSPKEDGPECVKPARNIPEQSTLL
jgi:putative SOS response-associated peptidase YedK